MDYALYNNGTGFVPLVKGKISAFKVRLPEANSPLKITVWDATTHTNLRTETVNVAAAETDYTFNITPLELQKDHEYVDSFLQGKCYRYKKPDGTDGIYPQTVGNLKITKVIYSSGTAGIPSYPTINSEFAFYGDVDLVFQRTE